MEGKMPPDQGGPNYPGNPDPGRERPEYPPANPPEYPGKDQPGREVPHPGQPGELPPKGPQGNGDRNVESQSGYETEGPDDVLPNPNSPPLE